MGRNATHYQGKAKENSLEDCPVIGGEKSSKKNQWGKVRGNGRTKRRRCA